MKSINFKKLHSKLNGLLTISIIILFSSCTTQSTFYVPNSQTVTLFEEKKELQLSANASTGELGSGFNGKAAYSITDKFAASASYYFGSAEQSEFVTTLDGKPGQIEAPFNLGELALGYYTGLGDSKGIFEVYGGWGMGGAQFDSKALHEAFQYNQFFVQPGIGGHLGPVDLAFSTRFNYALWKSDFEQFYLEPALTFRVGWEKVKFQLQALTSFSGEDLGLSSNQYHILGEQEEMYSLTFGVFMPIHFK